MELNFLIISFGKNECGIHSNTGSQANLCKFSNSRYACSNHNVNTEISFTGEVEHLPPHH
jgi:hypothetical protein